MIMQKQEEHGAKFMDADADDCFPDKKENFLCSIDSKGVCKITMRQPFSPNNKTSVLFALYKDIRPVKMFYRLNHLYLFPSCKQRGMFITSLMRVFNRRNQNSGYQRIERQLKILRAPMVSCLLLKKLAVGKIESFALDKTSQ